MQDIQLSLTFISGILLTAGIFYLILFFGFQRKIALLFLSLFCFFQTGKAIFRTDGQIAMQLFNLSETQSRLGTGISYTSGSFCLLAFLIFLFELSYKRVALVIAAFACLTCYLTKIPQLPVMLVLGIGAAIYTFKRNPLESSLVIFSLSVFGFTTYLEMYNFNSIGYYIGIIVFIVTITLLVGSQIWEHLRLQQEAQLRSSTLENQLLKKSLQPHFLFNSLMSLQEWIETRPGKAAQFVQALAEEFRSISHMSGNALITMEEELAMCKAHLEIMSFRKHATFKLETEGINGEELVPPAVFHTLVENGLTHGYANRHEGYFILKKEKIPGGASYCLFNDSQIEISSSERKNGTGLKYVKARLEESFPGKWKLESNQVEGGWVVRIEIMD